MVIMIKIIKMINIVVIIITLDMIKKSNFSNRL